MKGFYGGVLLLFLPPTDHCVCGWGGGVSVENAHLKLLFVESNKVTFSPL